jgi:hypothetical protein
MRDGSVIVCIGLGWSSICSGLRSDGENVFELRSYLDFARKEDGIAPTTSLDGSIALK